MSDHVVQTRAHETPTEKWVYEAPTVESEYIPVRAELRQSCSSKTTGNCAYEAKQ